jgi:hypothetical protein
MKRLFTRFVSEATKWVLITRLKRKLYGIIFVQYVPQRKPNISPLKISWLVLCKEIARLQ